MLISYILSALLEYDQLPYIYIIIPIVYMFNFFSLPNTPQYLVQKGKIEVRFAVYSIVNSKINLFSFEILESGKSSEVLQRLQWYDCS